MQVSCIAMINAHTSGIFGPWRDHQLMVTALFFRIDLHQRQAAKDCMSALRAGTGQLSFEIISSAISYETLGGAASPSPEPPATQPSSRNPEGVAPSGFSNGRMQWLLPTTSQSAFWSSWRCGACATAASRGLNKIDKDEARRIAANIASARLSESAGRAAPRLR